MWRPQTGRRRRAASENVTPIILRIEAIAASHKYAVLPASSRDHATESTRSSQHRPTAPRGRPSALTHSLKAARGHRRRDAVLARRRVCAMSSSGCGVRCVTAHISDEEVDTGRPLSWRSRASVRATSWCTPISPVDFGRLQCRLESGNEVAVSRSDAVHSAAAVPESVAAALQLTSVG